MLDIPFNGGSVRIIRKDDAMGQGYLPQTSDSRRYDHTKVMYYHMGRSVEITKAGLACLCELRTVPAAVEHLEEW